MWVRIHKSQIDTRRVGDDLYHYAIRAKDFECLLQIQEENGVMSSVTSLGETQEEEKRKSGTHTDYV